MRITRRQSLEINVFGLLLFALFAAMIGGAAAVAESEPTQEKVESSADAAESVDNAFECRSEIPEDEVSTLLARVENRYRDFTALRAKFVQYSFFTGLGEEVTSTGEVFFKKPGKMDWHYQSPDPQRFIADGTTIWFHQPELNQVTIGAFEAGFSSDLPVSFLLGVGALEENFKLHSACRSSSGDLLQLEPKKEDPNLEQFHLLVSREGIPIGAKMLDIGGNETRIVFRDVDLSVSLRDEQFTFEIPRGVDIIDQRNKKEPGA